MAQCIAVIITAIMPANAPIFAASAGKVSGTFIQLNRQSTEYSTTQWKAFLTRMQAIGIDTVFIQWTAEPPVLYFKDNDLHFNEQYDALERLMEAARGMSFSIFLGLQNDSEFWKEITARDKALRDYFLVRQAQNERVQAALLKAFGKRDDWVGYYIPDEIDDLSWRDAGHRRFLKDYLRGTIRILREHDARRAVAISAFFRTRTAPEVVVKNLDALTADIGLDYLLLQDGAGNNDPPEDVLGLYYRAMLNIRKTHAPELWAVLEAFRQTSGEGKPFTAEPAPPGNFVRQIQAASGFKRRILFSFPDYVDPGRGSAAQALYKMLGGHSGAPERRK